MQTQKYILTFGIVGCVLASIILFLCTHKNMTGVSYEEIAAYQAAHPHAKISYTVTIDGDDRPLKIKNRDTAVTLTSSRQALSLAEQAEYLQGLTSIDFGSLTPTAAQAAAVLDAFPNATVTYSQISLLEEIYSLDTVHLDLSHIDQSAAADAVCAVKALPKLESVNLVSADGSSPLSLEQALLLQNARPNLRCDYRFELFGMELTTDMERVEYLKAEIGDEGLDTIRSILPLMYNLNYLKLDWCGTSDEATAALRDELAEDGIKVVWRVFFGGKYGGAPYSALTDTYKIWANFTPDSENCKPLKYCTEVRYMDLGHSYLTDCEFVRYMPNLEVCILADSRLTDITPLTECKNLTFLEIFMTHVTDLTPLQEMPQLEFLNISEMFKLKDISPICGADVLPNLIQINVVDTFLPEKQVAQFKENHPNTANMFKKYSHSTAYGWRYDNHGVKVPQYALLRLQIGYNDDDCSRYPGGYVTEEITYESTGITPPDWYIIKHNLQDKYPLSSEIE